MNRIIDYESYVESSLAMEPQMNQDEKNIESMIEAQARGEQIESVETDESISQDAVLDPRTSKQGGSTLNELFNGTGGLGEASPSL